jgi:hypothetical protein
MAVKFTSSDEGMRNEESEKSQAGRERIQQLF